jgi:hypothetical protein
MEQPNRRWAQKFVVPNKKILNKTFFHFVFSFVAVVAGVLLFILVLGISSGGVQ